ncbi:MAG: hypothetical protein Q9190_007203 [Brigantiaea leucoxantha]
MEAQVENAIDIASNPTSDQHLKAQAFEFLHRLPSEPQCLQVCLSLFLREPKSSEIIRHTSLEMINNAVQRGQLDSQSFTALRESFVAYLSSSYGTAAVDGSKIDSTNIQSKFAQTLMYLFVYTYATEWPSFFHDVLNLASNPGSSRKDNVYGISFYLRVLVQIHDEIADVIVPRNPEELKRGNQLKDLVRERDSRMVAQSWQDILAEWRGRDYKIVEQCLGVMNKWVSWTDISLIVTDSLRNLLLELVAPSMSAAQGSQATRMREIAISSFVDILGKKMGPNDKLELIGYLNVRDVVSQLVLSPGLSELRATSNYDTDLAEQVARLVNNTVCDIIKVLDGVQDQDPVCLRGVNRLQEFLPFVLRFFSDEYDEICSTVIPCLTDLLTLSRKKAKSNSSIYMESSAMLPPILDAVVLKMKYDETSMWGNEDAQTDEAEFQELRKRLHILQQAVAAVDESLFMDKISNVVVTTFNNFQSQRGIADWRDLDLALYEMYLFGELGLKNGGLYSKTKPISSAAERLIGMMLKLLEADVVSSPHPAVQLQYMEICVRYYHFFEVNTQFISGVLENFVRLVHHDHVKVRTRSWYLFQRFVKQVRQHVGNVAETAIQAVSDLLPIKAELPDEASDDGDMSSDENQQSASAKFDSQLYLYEAVGCICSARVVPVENQVLYVRTVIDPLFSDLEIHLPPAKAGDERAVLQIHHLIMALATLARGFSDWSPADWSPSASPPAEEVSEEFARTCEAILVALETLNMNQQIREAARFAFSRLVGVLGSRILPQLPRWINGLLSQTSTKDEMALFMRLMDQVVYGFKSEIYDILNALLTPFLQRVFDGIAEPATGTDDEIQLAELKREYLSFILVVLNNNLATILSPPPLLPPFFLIHVTVNQSAFGAVISTMEHLAKDTSDYPTAKLAFSALNRMALTWGGPDIAVTAAVAATTTQLGNPAAAPRPKLPGFDIFMMERFSALCWALPTQPSFDPKDAQGRQALAEAATLAKTIYAKTGQSYLRRLRERELGAMGMDEATIGEYVSALRELDGKEFRQYFLGLVQRGKG